MIPLVAPTITGRDRGYMRERLSDGLLDDEREVRRFEERFAERVGCGWAVAVCSGTVALELALEALCPAATEYGIVHIPTYTCVAVRNASRGRSVSHLDSSFDVASARMTLEGVMHRLGIVTHMFGTATEGIYDIEDYSLSLGGVSRLIGKLGVCSTHESKMISTGRGGVVFGNGDELARVRELVEARSVGMAATQAALGVSQFDQLDTFIERRRTIAATYTERFRAAGIECPDADCGSVFFRYIIGVDDPAAAVAELAERGIEAGRGVYPPLHRLAGLDDADFPGATACVNRLLSVPCHPSVTDEQAAYVAEQVVQVCAP